MNASPAFTMIGSVTSTQPPSPTIANVSRPNRSPLSGSILKTDAFKMEAWDDPVIGKTEGEMRVFIERRHRDSLPRRPHSDITIIVNLDVDDIRTAAHRTIFDVLLARSRRHVDGHDDLFAARIADVSGFVIHRRPQALASASADGRRTESLAAADTSETPDSFSTTRKAKNVIPSASLLLAPSGKFRTSSASFVPLKTARSCHAPSCGVEGTHANL